MSEEQLKAFIEKVKSETELREKLNSASSPEAAMEIAKAAGFSITAEDIQSMQSETVELSDDELEAAAGGYNPGGWVRGAAEHYKGKMLSAANVC